MNEEIFKMYDEGRSPYEIAEVLKTYPNKIRRILKKAGKPIRDRGEAQKKALASGRVAHPTKGKQRSEATKLEISATMQETWKAKSPDQVRQHAERSKTRWEARSEEDKRAFLDEGRKAIRNSAKNGSKLERFLLLELNTKGYETQFHREHVFGGQRLQFDLFLPNEKIIIEVDGPSHKEAIWGQVNFNRNKKNDVIKEGLSILNGYNMIRVLHDGKIPSKINQANLVKNVIIMVEELKGTNNGIVKEIVVNG